MSRERNVEKRIRFQLPEPQGHCFFDVKWEGDPSCPQVRHVWTMGDSQDVWPFMGREERARIVASLIRRLARKEGDA